MVKEIYKQMCSNNTHTHNIKMIMREGVEKLIVVGRETKQQYFKAQGLQRCCRMEIMAGRWQEY